MDVTVVITTINPVGKGVREFRRLAPNCPILLVGDRKSATVHEEDGLRFLSLERQQCLDLQILKYLPYDHYVRKNIGYLVALREGAEAVYDTDDDNIPYPTWSFPTFNGLYRKVSGTKYVNVYKNYTDDLVWPRGFPLTKVRDSPVVEHTIVESRVGIWQGLADDDPDVDAIFRLTVGTQIRFAEGKPLVLSNGVYCPFNSQNTLWHKDAMPYAYLPTTVTFRFTDILRGYVAQRCLWEHGWHLGFTGANVYQERNYHDLLRDFESEVPCYLQVEQLVNSLDSLQLSTDWERNLVTIYSTLAKTGIVKDSELSCLAAWVADFKRMG